MKTREQLDKEMPARLLSAACFIIACVHFIKRHGEADFVLLGFVALCAAPWMGDVFESISKDGVKYRIKGESPAPPAAPVPPGARAPQQQQLFAPAPAQQAQSEFSTMTFQEKKVLATLWIFQKRHFPGRADRRWTFTVIQGSPEFMEFSYGFLLLARRQYAVPANNGQVMLSDIGYNFCLANDVEISTWPYIYDKFSN